MLRYILALAACFAVAFAATGEEADSKQAEASNTDTEEGFISLFNGEDLSGWKGDKVGNTVEDGKLVANYALGNLYTEEQYADFILRFEFKLTEGANNGIGVRVPMFERASKEGFELQILDNEAEKYNDLDPYQYHGSVYGVIPAKRCCLKPVGDWNEQEVIAKGPHIKVILNGETILDADLTPYRDGSKAPPDGKEHPGLKRDKGHISLCGHTTRVEFRNLRIKPLNGEGDAAKAVDSAPQKTKDERKAG